MSETESLVTEKTIFLDASLDDKSQVINFIANQMLQLGRTKNGEGLLADIYAREAETSTSMGLGVAIPHTQSKNVESATLVMVRTQNPITWNDDTGISLIFGILVPSDNPDNQHLKILSKLARRLMDDEFRNYLLNESDISKLVQILQ